MSRLPPAERVLRLHVCLGIDSLPRVRTRLWLAGQTPQVTIVDEDGDSIGYVVLDFDRASEPASKDLSLWVQDMAGVTSVRIEWQFAESRRR